MLNLFQHPCLNLYEKLSLYWMCQYGGMGLETSSGRRMLCEQLNLQTPKPVPFPPQATSGQCQQLESTPASVDCQSTQKSPCSVLL
jgi:hypothetical protein